MARDRAMTAGAVAPRPAPLPLLIAAHIGPSLAVTTVVALLSVAADLSPGKAVIVTAAVFTGQLTIGWGNDLLDASRDRAVGRADKPLANGSLDASLVRRCLVVAAVACVVLSFARRLAQRADPPVPRRGLRAPLQPVVQAHATVVAAVRRRVRLPARRRVFGRLTSGWSSRLDGPDRLGAGRRGTLPQHAARLRRRRRDGCAGAAAPDRRDSVPRRSRPCSSSRRPPSPCSDPPGVPVRLGVGRARRGGRARGRRARSAAAGHRSTPPSRSPSSTSSCSRWSPRDRVGPGRGGRRACGRGDRDRRAARRPLAACRIARPRRLPPRQVVR